MANKAFYHLLNIKKSCIGQKCHAAYGNPEAPCSPSKYNCPLLSLKHKGDFLHTIHEVGATPLYVNATSLRYGRTHTLVCASAQRNYGKGGHLCPVQTCSRHERHNNGRYDSPYRRFHVLRVLNDGYCAE